MNIVKIEDDQIGINPMINVDIKDLKINLLAEVILKLLYEYSMIKTLKAKRKDILMRKMFSTVWVL